MQIANLPEDPQLYSYCTSVGILTSYDSVNKTYSVKVKSWNTSSYKIYCLNEPQYIMWFVCHGHIISQVDVYEQAYTLYSKTNEIKYPMYKAFQELSELGLIFIAEDIVEDAAIQEVAIIVQPYVINLKNYNNIKKTMTSFLFVLRKTIMTLFLPTQEKIILKYLSSNPNASLLNYLSSIDLSKGQSLLIGKNINHLLSEGYICAIGWGVASITDIK